MLVTTSSYKENDIICFRITTGEEIVAKLKTETDTIEQVIRTTLVQEKIIQIPFVSLSNAKISTTWSSRFWRISVFFLRVIRPWESSKSLTRLFIRSIM